MNIPSGKVIAINVALVSLIIGGAVTFGRSFLAPPPAEVCSKRYTTVSTLALETGGNLATPVDFQARASGRDVGVLQNLSFRRTTQGPSPVVMAVKIPTIEADAPRGISYPWSPKIVRGKLAGCLTYNVFLPQDFNFGPGGLLPGFTAVRATEDDKDPVETLGLWPMWGAAGETNFLLRKRKGKEEESLTFDGENVVELPRGRWVSIEQEIALNTPVTAKNGVVRMWIDGRLVIQDYTVEFRADTKMLLSGVAADVHYGRSIDTLVRHAPKAATLWFSPIEVRVAQ